MAVTCKQDDITVVSATLWEKGETHQSLTLPKVDGTIKEIRHSVDVQGNVRICAVYSKD